MDLKFVLWSLLICNVHSISNSTDRCSPEYCNFAGECTLVNRKPNCTCYDEAFQGKYCEKVKDLCATSKNTCTGTQICVPYVGQIVCVCRPEIRSQDCDLAKPLCSYNVQVNYGVEEPIVLSFAYHSPEPLRIIVSSENNLIARSRSPMKGQYTRNLTATLHELGIRRHIKPPYDDAFYYVFKTKHTIPGANLLNVTIESKSRNKMDYSMISLSLPVHVRTNFCIPRVVFQHCMDPHNPRKVDSEQFCNLQAIMEDRCLHSKPILQVQWAVYKYEEHTDTYMLKEDDQLLFKIPHYFLWRPSLLRSYPDLLVEVQLSVKEQGGPWVFTKCYLNVTARNVVAKIAGGDYREVSTSSPWLTLDGSSSIEPGQNINHTQELTYTWSVEFHGEDEEVYLSKDSPEPNLTISMSVLKTKISTITLQVTNKFVKVRTAKAKQVIVLIDNREPFHLEIECLRNCKGNFVAADQVIHLRSVCTTCLPPISNTWYLSALTHPVHNKRHLIMRVDNDMLVGDKLTVEVIVKDNGGNVGNTGMRLKRSYPPRGGICKIEPKVGKECTTKFHISCLNFTTQIEEPLLYTFKMGNLYVERTNSPETFLYLNREGTLTAHICSYHFGCTVVDLPVVIDDSNSNNVPDLNVMLAEGRRQQAFCFMQLVSHKPENMIHFVDADISWGDKDSATILEMVNTLEIAENCISALKSLKNPEVRVVSHTMRKVAYIFDFVSTDTEALDLTEAIWFDMVKSLTHMITFCMIPDLEILKLNSFLLVPNTKDKEVYIDWMDFNHHVAMRMNHIVSIVKGIFILWRNIGQHLAQFIQPGETLNYILNDVSFKAEMFDKFTPIQFISNGTNCYIKSPLKTTAFLRKLLNTNSLLIYSWCLKSDVLWWVPGISPPNSASMAINIFGRNMHTNDLTALPNDFASYSIGLRRHLNTTNYYYQDSNEVLYHAIIYSVKLQSKANLVVQLWQTSVDFRVLITMHVKPVLRNIYDKSYYVPKGSLKKTIILNNLCPQENTAYIAIYRAEPNALEPANFTVRIRSQQCNVFDLSKDNPTWQKFDCSLKTITRNRSFSQCHVHYLSVFSATAYKVEPFEIQQIANEIFVPPVCSLAVIFFCSMILGVVALLLLATLRARYRRKNLIRVMKSRQDEVDPSAENVIVHLRTGGGLLSFTTANVTLEFVSDLGRYKVVIYQNPVNPHLGLGTSRMIRLSDRKVQLPCRLTISHDLSGRYPSWYCRSIQVDDLRNDLSYTFPLHCWIRHDQKVIVSCYPMEKKKIIHKLHKIKPIEGFLLFLRRFRFYSRLHFTDWFILQPIFGPWRYTDASLNAYQRTCIFICKVIITITVVFCFYRNSTIYNRYKFHKYFKLLDINDILALFIGSYMLVIFLNFCLDHLSLP
ncbi:uncharacterized protein LOC122756869 [Drosophila mojavensis]|uniref:uncharacterized protein LOC122756869 n=1 Tax=Drosophila mojavensis TaxID=7230 RepID=UPI001CD144B1|nr:uncharacterized protein LOC122756869 [Drosophila mojavensis]